MSEIIRTYSDWPRFGRYVPKGAKYVWGLDPDPSATNPIQMGYPESQTLPVDRPDSAGFTWFEDEELAQAALRERKNAARRVTRYTIKMDWTPKGYYGKDHHPRPCVLYYVTPADSEFRAAIKQGKGRYNMPGHPGWFGKPATEAEALAALDKWREWDQRNIVLGPALATLDANRTAPVAQPVPELGERIVALMGNHWELGQASIAATLRVPCDAALQRELDALVDAGALSRHGQGRVYRPIRQPVAA